MTTKHLTASRRRRIESAAKHLAAAVAQLDAARAGLDDVGLMYDATAYSLESTLISAASAAERHAQSLADTLND